MAKLKKFLKPDHFLYVCDPGKLVLLVVPPLIDTVNGEWEWGLGGGCGLERGGARVPFLTRTGVCGGLPWRGDSAGQATLAVAIETTSRELWT